MNIYIENQNDIIHETSVDFVLRPCAKEIHIVQYDKSLPVIKVDLFRNGEKYIIPDEAAINIRFGKLDHTFVMKPVLGCNEEKTAVYFEVDEQMTVIAGRVSPVLEMIIGSNIAYSSPIGFVIDKNPVQMSDVESATVVYPIIYELIGTVAQFESRISALESQLIDLSSLENRVDILEGNASIWNAKYTKPSTGIPASDLAETYIIANEFNTQNGTGVNSVQQKQSDKDVEFENPNYTPSYTYEVGAFGKDSAMLNGNSMAKGELSIAIGRNTLAEGARSFASGTKTAATGNNAHAEGLQTLASGANGAHAEGNATVSSGSSSHAEGNNTKAPGGASHAEGTSTIAYGNYSHAGGRSSEARGESSFAHGQGIYVNQLCQVGFGKFNRVDSNILFVIGNGTSASARLNAFEVYQDGHATVGGKTIATTDDIPANIQNGTGTKAISQSYDTGYGNTIDMSVKNPNAWTLYQASGATSSLVNKGATGDYASSFGGISAAQGKRAHAEGTNTIAIGKYSHAEGDNSVALGHESHAEGNQTVTNGSAAHSEGFSTQALGNNTHAEGSKTIAYAENAHSEGYASIVKDNYIIVDHGVTPTPTPTPTPDPSTPEEKDALNGVGAHAEGHNTFALGTGSHAEGDSTKAYGRLSHAEGRSTEAGEIIIRKSENNKDYYTPNQDKQFQHAEGERTKAIGHASHAEGFHTIANQDYQHVSGKYNNNKSNTLFEVGNGTDNTHRNNAFEVYVDGTLGIPNFDANGNKIGYKRIKCINGVLTIID